MAFLAGIAATLALFTFVFLALLWRAPLMDDEGHLVSDSSVDAQDSGRIVNI